MATLKPLSITADNLEDLRLQVNYVFDKLWSIINNISGVTQTVTSEGIVDNEITGSYSYPFIDGGFPAADVTVKKIADAIIDASKVNSKQVWIMGAQWQSNAPVVGSVAWNTHELYWNGTKYTINSGNTGTENKYIYWVKGSNAYSITSDCNMVKGNFIIAVNINGDCYEVWNNLIAPEWIDTAMMACGAITQPVSSYTDSEINNGDESPYSTELITVQEASIKSTGAPIYINATFRWWISTTASGTKFYIKLYRDTTRIFSSSFSTGHNFGFFPLGLQDLPGSGIHTYYLKCSTDSSSINWHVYNRSLFLLETKR